MADAPGTPTAPSYRVFGGVGVVFGEDVRPVTQRREGSVLAVLLAAHGDPIPADRLVMDVWGEQAPPQALGSLQVAVSRLRSLIEPGRSPRAPARRLASTAGGYRISATDRDVDAWSFEAAGRRAASARDPADRLAAAEEAVGWWSGEPFAGCEASAVRREVDRLGELLAGVQEIRGQALLDLGRAEEAARVLADLTPEHPYRERLWAQLAVAQYRCARQADALTTLATLRRRLGDELGVDPSPEVQQLETDVLRQSETLDTPASAPVPADPADATSAGPVTVGREASSRVVADLVAGLVDGTTAPATRTLLVAGEPGIGKTHLVAGLVHAAEHAGARVVVGRCQDGDFAPAFWPWLAPLRSLAAGLPDASADPTLDALLRDDDATGLADGSTMRLFDAVADLLSRAAEDRPTALVLEDVHWADTSSLRLLSHVVETMQEPGRGARLLVVCTRRTADAPTSPALVDTLSTLSRSGAERIRLEGLVAEDVTTLLARHLGDHSVEIDRVVEEATSGNPFFVLEYARLLLGMPEETTATLAALPVPEGVRDVLRRRLVRLPEDVRDLLVAAAVVGRDIDPALLADVADVPRERVLDLLDLALASGLLAVRADGYAFAHSLTREAVHDDVPAARRMRLHDRAGRSLEVRASTDRDVVAAVAHHCLMAAPLSDELSRRAVDALARAARDAERRYAHDEALDLWDQAAEVAGRTGAGVDRVTALCGATRAALRLGRTPAGRERVDAAVRLARELGRWDMVADAAGLLNGAGVWSWREHGTLDEPFIGVLREALDHVDQPRRARLLATLQMEHYYGMDSHVADDYGAEAARLARQTGDETLLLEVLFVSVVAEWGPGKASRRLAVLEELREHELGEEGTVLTDFQYGVTLYECNRVAEADQVMARVAVASARLRHTGVELPFSWWRFARALDRGAPDAAAIGEAAIEEHRRRGFVAWVELECVHAVCVLAPGAAVPDEIVEMAGTAGPGLRALVAFAMLESGEPQRARVLLGDPSPAAANHYAVMAGNCLGAAVLAATGTDDEHEEALARISPHRGEVLTYGTVAHLGAVDYCLALCHQRLGDLALAQQLARDAARPCRELDNAPWAERAEALASSLRSHARTGST